MKSAEHAPETSPNAADPLGDLLPTNQTAANATGRTKRPIEKPVTNANAASAPAMAQAPNQPHADALDISLGV